jgi:cellulose synthase/poly-beta-1,6-N-acetylglucosamine synthase-like glycosyltransferase
VSRGTAVVIACRNGAATIASAVGSAVHQADVYVISDGSTDQTVELARAAGAQVLERPLSAGKAAALRAGVEAFSLATRYAYIAVLDDDTTIAPTYVAQTTQLMDADAGVAASSGRIDSLWDERCRWNVLIAFRAFMYWSYQVTIKRSQNALHVVNVVCGANSVFRAEIFADLIADDPPYAIDDMYWLAEIVRRRLGRVAYVHTARSWTIDPHRFGDWYRQTVRWSWGQLQSVRGHGLGVPLRRTTGRRRGLRVSWFDLAYLSLLVDLAAYMLAPLALPLLVLAVSGWVNPFWFAVFFLAESLCWIGVAAYALRRPRLLALAPALILLDLVYRIALLHALVKTLRQPTVTGGRWDSPRRFVQDPAVAGD